MCYRHFSNLCYVHVFKIGALDLNSQELGGKNPNHILKLRFELLTIMSSLYKAELSDVECAPLDATSANNFSLVSGKKHFNCDVMERNCTTHNPKVLQGRCWLVELTVNTVCLFTALGKVMLASEFLLPLNSTIRFAFLTCCIFLEMRKEFWMKVWLDV